MGNPEWARRLTSVQLPVLIAGVSWCVSFACAFNYVECDNNIPIADRLKGKNLTIAELEWSPFGTRDPTQTGNDAWSGFDLEVLKPVAALLDFTYTIVPMEKGKNETWTESILRTVDKADFILCYWFLSAERRARMTQMLGHVQADYMLVIKTPEVLSTEFADRMDTFLKPFTYRLWGLICLMILVAGLVMYALEKDFIEAGASGDFENLTPVQAATLSVYFAFGLFVQTGGPAPQSTTGRLFVIIFGLTVLVLLSCYTASMATFLVMNSQATDAITGVEDLMNRGLPACIDESSAIQQSAINALYPKLVLDLHPNSELPSLIKSGQCHAAVSDLTQIAIWKMNKNTGCHLNVLSQSLLSNSAGWVTHRSRLCLANTVDWALQEQINRALVKNQYDQWTTPAICTGASDARRDGNDFLSMLTESTSEAFHGTPIEHTPALNEAGRRAAGGGAAAAAAASGGGDAQQLDIPDLAGVFMMFGLGVFVVIGIKMARMYLCPAFVKEDDAESVHCMKHEIKTLHEKVDECITAMKALGNMGESQARILDEQRMSIMQMRSAISCLQVDKLESDANELPEKSTSAMGSILPSERGPDITSASNVLFGWGTCDRP